MGFSMIFNIPRRLLWVVAIGGIIAVCTRNFVNLGPSPLLPDPVDTVLEVTLKA